jgi:hypothetical protein
MVFFLLPQDLFAENFCAAMMAGRAARFLGAASARNHDVACDQT